MNNSRYSYQLSVVGNLQVSTSIQPTVNDRIYKIYHEFFYTCQWIGNGEGITFDVLEDCADRIKPVEVMVGKAHE